MSAELLLREFERLSEAPDAVPRLRRFILELAVRGKLVPQNPADEPSSVLLKRIRDGAAPSRRRNSDNTSATILPEEEPFELPRSWRWARFGDLVAFAAGRTPARHESSYWNTGDYPWVSIADMPDGGVVSATKETVSAKAKVNVFRAEPSPIGTLIMSFKLTIGKIARLGIPAFHNEAIISIVPDLSELDAYLFKVLPYFGRLGKTKDAIKGATLNRESLSNLILPLPPLAEQFRMLTRVDQLMALCDRLEAAQAERERRRVRGATVSLQRVDEAMDASAVRPAAGFYVSNGSRLVRRSEDLAGLRSTIRNLAVHGHLGGNKQRTHEWEMTTVGEACDLITSGPRGWGEYYAEQGPKFIRAQNIRFGRLRLDEVAHVQPPVGGDRSRTLVFRNDLFIVITGAGVTNPAMLDVDLGAAYVSQHVALIRPSMPQISRWLLLWLMAPAGVRNQLLERAYGAGKPGLNLENIRTLPLHVPPLAEQDAILAEVDRLMGLCASLDAAIAVHDTETSRLLNAVLGAALDAT